MTDQAGPARPPHRVLVFSCDDRPGIVHAIAGAVVEAGGDITESQQFSSADTGRFFMRLQIQSAADDDRLAELLEPYRPHRHRVQALLGMRRWRARHGPRMAPRTHLPAG